MYETEASEGVFMEQWSRVRVMNGVEKSETLKVWEQRSTSDLMGKVRGWEGTRRVKNRLANKEVNKAIMKKVTPEATIFQPHLAPGWRCDPWRAGHQEDQRPGHRSH